MSFRRFTAFFALLFAAGACTLGSFPRQTSAPGISGLPPEIEREVGPVYASPTVQAFVNRVGQKVAAASGLPGPFHFFVLDDPGANAHAITTGGYVFVTRGLLAMIDDESELAAAFGHAGHIKQGHAAQRERVRRAVTDAAIKAATSSGSITVGRSVAREGLLALRRYSRDQELEADRVGLGLIINAGYRGEAMADLIMKLELQTKLEDAELGDLAAAAPGPDAFSTHPDPDERLATLRALPATRTPGTAGREAYLDAVEGMSVDDAPEEGFVRGTSFVHPLMRLAFTAPSDFTLFNDHEGVLGVGRDRSVLYFSCTDEKIDGPLADWMRNELKPTPTDIEATVIGGAEAAIGSRPRGSDTGLDQIRYVLIRRGKGVCYFNLMSEGPDRDRRIDTLVTAARSFHALTAAEAEALRPYSLHVVSSAGTTAAALAARMPYADHKMLRLLVLNGVDQPEALMRLPQVKIVVP